MFNKKIKQPQPISKGLYAWNAIHAGSFLLFIESLKDCHKFLFLPGPAEFFLTFEDFAKCLQTNALEFVESVPNDVFEESIRISSTCPSNNPKIICNENDQSQN